MGRKRLFTDKERKERARERNRRWRKEHAEQNKENQRRWREAHKEELKSAKSAYHKNNRDKIIEKVTEWCRNNISRSQEIKRQWQQQHSDEHLESCHRYNRNHPEYVANKSAHRHSMIGNQQITKEAWLEVMKKWRFHCAYCGITLTSRTRTVDHVVPLAQGGRHHENNLVPACRSCNTRKNNRCPEQWSQMPRNNNSWKILYISLCEKLRLLDVEED